MKCYYYNSLYDREDIDREDMEKKFQNMVQELLNNKREFNAFTSYITSHYNSFSHFSKIVVGRIYMRFQEDAITTEDPEQDMEYIHYESRETKK